MKSILRQINHRPSPAFTALIHQHLEQLGRQVEIEEARVVIERREEASPAFFISAYLVTPGPDLFAESCAHTLRAALQKTVEQLDEKIRHRTEKRARRVRSNLQQPAIHRAGPVATANR
jgi:ribosome-associated translation inhibitor RaiA